MPIPFPRMHIAESVLNRIFNTLEGDMESFNPPIEQPIIPDATAEGANVENALATPPAPAAPTDPEVANAGALDSVLSGGSAFNGALMGAIQP